MVLVAQRDPAYAIERVDWSLLLFFASLFVVMRGVEQTGAVAWIDRHPLALSEPAPRWPARTPGRAARVQLWNLFSNVQPWILGAHTGPHSPSPGCVCRGVPYTL